MERWVEHYQELYSRENIVSTAAVENRKAIPLMEELDVPPSIDELREAIDSLANGKAPGNDGILPEVVKAGKSTALHHHLHELLLQCWEEGTVPQDMRDVNIITLYKNKGDRSDCNNIPSQYRRESLCPSTPENDFLLSRRHARHRPARRHILGPLPNQKRRETGMRACSTLFGTFSLLLSYAFKQLEDGVYLHTRNDGSLFNRARLLAKSKVRKVLIREMLFADDAALTAHTEEVLQRLINCFVHACKEFALTISIKKTNAMVQDVSSIPNISIDGHILEMVGEFTYLGSTISSNLSLDAELNKRIGKAATALVRLGKRVWDNAMLTTNTKIVVYQACVLSMPGPYFLALAKLSAQHMGLLYLHL
ncbi:uncharacterized protein LOC143041672 [Oratosquilla oratoria]|uniref:uncharacterized protein LOC143041672 n=1 Tax=Oratosquilla oratoria TaxID=337810 RepID=UPI003F760622